MKNLLLLDGLNNAQKAFITEKANKYSANPRVYVEANSNSPRVVLAIPHKVQGWVVLMEAGKEDILIPSANLEGYIIAYYPYMEHFNYHKTRKYSKLCNSIIETVNSSISDMQDWEYDDREIKESVDSELDNELSILEDFKDKYFIKDLKRYILSRI